MALLTATQITKDGVVRTLAAVAASDTVECGDRTFVEIANGNASTITVTITTPNTESGLAIADQTVEILTGVTKIIGPLTRDLFGNSSGIATIACSLTPTVTIAAFKV